MPSISIWFFWIIGGVIAVGYLFFFLSDNCDDGGLLIWPIIFGILTIASSTWYLNAAEVVRKTPVVRERIGVVENTTLPNGSKISIVKYNHGIMNLTDTFHTLIPDGAIFTQWRKVNEANGIIFVGNNQSDLSGCEWVMPENLAK